MDRRYRILYIIPQLGVGGAEKQLVELTEFLDKKFEPIVCSLTSTEIFAKKCRMSSVESILPLLKKNGIKVIVLGKKNKYDFLIIYKLARIMKANNIDIVQTYFTANFWGTIAAKIAKVSIILFSERSGGHFTNNFHIFLYRFFIRFADKIISNSKIGMEKVMQRLRINSDKAAFIYNGISPERFNVFLDEKEKMKEILLIPTLSPVVGVIANLHSYVKGHIYFLKAAKIILRQLPETLFLIIGEGRLREELEDLSRRLGIFENVRFLGSRQDIPELLSVMDVSVLPSLREGFSNVILESMAMSKPVVVTDAGGNSEIVVNGETGYIVPLKDSESLAKAILDLLYNREKAEQMGKVGRDRVKNNFSIDKMVKGYERLYEDIIKNKLLQ